MKKIILSLALLVVISFASCQEKTKESVQDATDAIGSEMEQKMDTIAQKTSDAFDSTKVKTKEVVRKVGDKLDKTGDKIDEKINK